MGSNRFDEEIYQSAVGKLLFLSTRTRPDITFAVGCAARYIAKPLESHWKVVKHIIRYIAGTSNFGLLFTKETAALGFSDSDWAGDINDRKSTSGYLFKIGGATDSWKSQKQAFSTAKAENMSLALAAQEAVWHSKELKTSQNQPLFMKKISQQLAWQRIPSFMGEVNT